MPSLIELALIVTWALMIGYVGGRFGRRQDRRADFSFMQVERKTPMPPYLHVVDFDRLELRPTVRLIKPEATEEAEAVSA